MTDELLKLYTPAVETVTLVPSSQGRFEVSVDGKLIYSKKAIGRHAEPGEIVRLFAAETGVQPAPRE